MYRAYFFDVSAIFVLLAVILATIIRKMYRGKVNRMYFAMLLMVLATTVFDILRGTALTGLPATPGSLVFRTIFCSLYFASWAFFFPYFTVTICVMTGTMKTPRFCHPFFFPLAAQILLILLNPFFDTFFYYEMTPEGTLAYHWGSMLWLFNLLGLYFGAYSLGILIWNRKRMQRSRFIGLAMVFPIDAFSILLQELFPTFLISMFGAAISMLLVSFFVLRPEEEIDQTTGARSLSAFLRDIENIYHAGDPAVIYFAKLKNDSFLREMLESEIYRKMALTISRVLISTTRGSHWGRSQLYYMHNGLFAAIVEGKHDEEAITGEIEGLMAQYENGQVVDGMDIRLEVCAAGVRIPEDIDNLTDLRHFMDSFHTMIGPGKVVMYADMAPDRDFMILNNIDRIINDAIRERRFYMAYQPIYSLKEHRFKSAEALIRLRDEKYGNISPAVFIPAAERSGRILDIGDFVIEDVCRFMSEHSPYELGVDYIEVNLSIIQCMQEDMAERIQKYMELYHVEPDRINFEITETASDTAYETVLNTMHRISKNGGNFSLDDYGSGYSNLHRVMSFPYKIIKIDKSLTDEAVDADKRRILLEAIHLIKSLGAEIVVEGVEDEEVAKWFEENGCDYIQGFYYAKPMPETEFMSFLNREAQENADISEGEVLASG